MTTTAATGRKPGGSRPADPANLPAPAPTTRRWLEGAHDLVVNGCRVQAHGRMETIDPGTEEVLAEVSCADEADVDQAVRAARTAVADRRWSGLAPDERASALLRVAIGLELASGELAEIETLDVGKPLEQSRSDVAVAAEIFRYYAGWTTKLHGTVNPTSDDLFSFSSREPRGVCAAIVPWNYPIVMAALKVAPAIACGNTVVLKPAEQTPLNALRLAEICLEADVRPGVVNVVPGLGPVTGAALAAHAGVDLVSFTGSTPVGKTIVAASAVNLNPVMLELGGKSPNIVFADAPLDAAVTGALEGIWTNAGQWCVAGSRLLVERPVHDEVLERLVAATAVLRIGHGLDPATDVGPLVSSAQQRRVVGYLESARSEGAIVALGGYPATRPGYFVEPTIFTDVNPSMRVAHEEIFGPVLTVIPFDCEEQAIAIANDTCYGLAAGIWTTDLARAHRLSRALDAGMVWVNTYGRFDCGTSYGGYKQSGFGRELGPHSLDSYTQIKSVLLYFDVDQGARP